MQVFVGYELFKQYQHSKDSFLGFFMLTFEVIFKYSEVLLLSNLRSTSVYMKIQKYFLKSSGVVHSSVLCPVIAEIHT